jgi:hypothetical protein
MNLTPSYIIPKVEKLKCEMAVNATSKDIRAVFISVGVAEALKELEALTQAEYDTHYGNAVHHVVELARRAKEVEK